MVSPRPLIGITCDYEPNPEYPLRRDACKQHVGFYLAVEEAGGLPVLLPAVSDREKLAGYLERLDGLLFSGAKDLPPEVYGKIPHPRTEVMSRQRFEFEWPLAQLALAARMPLLGICGGIQLMNAAAGGTLVQDIPDQVPGALAHRSGTWEDARHAVEVEAGSRLAEIFGPRPIVNSAHHQALEKVGEGYEVTARAEDGVIEAIERPGERFVVGVQWHPERCLDLPGMRELFAAFVAACRDGRRS